MSALTMASAAAVTAEESSRACRSNASLAAVARHENPLFRGPEVAGVASMAAEVEYSVDEDLPQLPRPWGWLRRSVWPPGFGNRLASVSGRWGRLRRWARSLLGFRPLSRWVF